LIGRDGRTWFCALFFAAAVVLLLGAAAGPCRAESYQVLVGGREIDPELVDAAVRMKSGMIGVFHGTREGEPSDRLVRSALNDVASRELFCIAARQTGLSVSAAEVDSYLTAVGKRYGGLEKYRSFLESIGVPLPAFRKVAAQALLARKYDRERLSPRTGVTDAMVEEHYRKNIADYKTRGEKRMDVLIITSRDPSVTEVLREVLGPFEISFHTRNGIQFYRSKVMGRVPGKVETSQSMDILVKEDLSIPYWSKIEDLEGGDAIVLPGTSEEKEVYRLFLVKTSKSSRTTPLSEVREEIREKMERQLRSRLIKEELERVGKEHPVEIRWNPGTSTLQPVFRGGAGRIFGDRRFSGPAHAAIPAPYGGIP
jgi:hypothetical protein